MNIPEGYQTVMPYLILNKAKQFLQFTQEVFGAVLNYSVPRDGDEEVIMHAEISIGGSIIMFADATEQWRTSTAGLFIYVEDADTTFQKAIDNGGQVVTVLSDQDYGRSGGVLDPFGNTWWITTPLENQ